LAMNKKLLDILKINYPNFTFKEGSRFAFRPPKTIIFGPDEPFWDLLLLHELGHALSGHQTYDLDINRVKMEMEAWEKAKELSLKYGVNFDEELSQEELDSYRNWLHQKSRCPKCGLTRFQTPDSLYHCPRCENLT